MFTGNQGFSASLKIPIPVPVKAGVADTSGSLICRPLVVRAQKPASVESSAKPRGGTSGALPVVLGLRHHSFHSVLVCMGGSLCVPSGKSLGMFVSFWYQLKSRSGKLRALCV